MSRIIKVMYNTLFVFILLLSLISCDNSIHYENVITFNSTELHEAHKYKTIVTIHMGIKEVALLIRKLKTIKNNYFEFGVGGSTELACLISESLSSKFNIYAIDSSEEWINKVKEKSCIKNMIINNKINFTFVNTGKVGAFGVPLEHDKKSFYPSYSNAIIQLHNESIPIDLILVDGRFRQSCVLNSLLVYPNAEILIHDFYEPSHHRNYKNLQEYAYVLESADTLVHLKRKALSDEYIKAKSNELSINFHRKN